MKNIEQVELRALDVLCKLRMCDDPTVLSPVEHAYFESWLNIQCQLHGFQDWVDVYHREQGAGMTDTMTDEERIKKITRAAAAGENAYVLYYAIKEAFEAIRQDEINRRDGLERLVLILSADKDMTQLTDEQNNLIFDCIQNDQVRAEGGSDG